MQLLFGRLNGNGVEWDASSSSDGQVGGDGGAEAVAGATPLVQVQAVILASFISASYHWW